MDSYDLDPQRVKRSLRAIEGQWRDGRHVKGGLKFSTPRGSQHVRLMPFQAWLIFEIYAFKVDVSMEREYHDGDMLTSTLKQYISKMSHAWKGMSRTCCEPRGVENFSPPFTCRPFAHCPSMARSDRFTRSGSRS